MKKIYVLMVTVFLMGVCVPEVNAQGILGKIKDKVKEKVDQKIDNAINGAVNDVDKTATDKVKGKKGKADDDGGYEDAEEGVDNPDAATSSDFKRGEVIMFQDDLEKEPVGEFPSKWDLIDGSAEVKTLGGKKGIEVTNNGYITPLIEEQGAYLPEEFTIEYDFYYWNDKGNIGLNDVKLVIANTKNRSERADEPARAAFILQHPVNDNRSCVFRYNNGTWGDCKDTGFEHTFKQGWHHVAVSFNKRALKAYIDGKRVVNLPRVQQGTWFGFQVPFDYHDLTFIRNVVLAKGAVALYDRDAQSMTAVEKAIAETGKFVTNNILFETGKATLKQESMAEIQKVAEYMKANPTARFEVQGHTDNQGSDAINDPLSQQRAEAVVKTLEGMGVDGFNLKAVGKGSHVPVADNKTEAGRAQNRRVEFIKK
ncbi:MAG: OmpA family protein [Bacteroidaceae bacterium]|nr:OmpA family protein [Bacteroidaceae bacterium]